AQPLGVSAGRNRIRRWVWAMAEPRNPEMNCYKLLLLFCALSAWPGLWHPAMAATAETEPASSEIRKQSNGYWLFAGKTRMQAFAGVVYQNTAGDMHVLSFSNSLHSLYYGLNQEVEGGAGHGERLARMGFQAIRVYELPVENQDDAERTK